MATLRLGWSTSARLACSCASYRSHSHRPLPLLPLLRFTINKILAQCPSRALHIVFLTTIITVRSLATGLRDSIGEQIYRSKVFWYRAIQPFRQLELCSLLPGYRYCPDYYATYLNVRSTDVESSHNESKVSIHASRSSFLSRSCVENHVTRLRAETDTVLYLQRLHGGRLSCSIWRFVRAGCADLSGGSPRSSSPTAVRRSSVDRSLRSQPWRLCTSTSERNGRAAFTHVQ